MREVAVELNVGAPLDQAVDAPQVSGKRLAVRLNVRRHIMLGRLFMDQ
jgi:hypothetical protein